MKVYVVPYGKDTKVYTSKEAAEKACDRIAYNIEMSGSNNPIPSVIETDILEESLNEPLDSPVVKEESIGTEIFADADSLDTLGNEPSTSLIDKAL